LGVRKEDIIERFLTMRPMRFEVARQDLRCDFVVAEIDDESGRTRRIEHHQMILEE
jgi:calcineurin-like phosphoesterase